MRRVYEAFTRAPASVVLSESEVKSLTTMLSDPPFATIESRVSRNEIYETFVHPYLFASGPTPDPAIPLFHFFVDSRKWEQWTVLSTVAWNFVCDLRYGSDSFAEDERGRTRRSYIFISRNNEENWFSFLNSALIFDYS